LGCGPRGGGREGGRREKESERERKRETRDVIGKIRDLVFEKRLWKIRLCD